MSDLTINSVCFKKQIYPLLLNFQNGNPSENFEFDCAFIQDEGGNKAIATEFNRLLYAGSEETEDLGQTFLLARNRKTGKVRLIEAGRASLKPFSEYAAEEPENSVSEPDKSDNPQLKNTNKFNSNRRNHIPEKETNYELVKIHSPVLEPSELEPNQNQNQQQLQASELEPRGPNPLPLSEHNEVEANRFNHLQSLETSELESDGIKYSPLVERSELKLKTNEFNLNTLNDNKDFSTEKMIFMRALGLNMKVGETIYSEYNVHSSPANNEQKIYVVQNAPDDDSDTASLEGKTYICGYCYKTSEDKGSIIFHLLSHKTMMNAKNVGKNYSNDNIYKKTRRHNERSAKKTNHSNTTEKTKVIDDNVLKHWDGDDNAIYKGVKVPGSDSVIIQNTLHNEIKVTDNLKDFSDDSPIHFAEENRVLNHHCDHCDKIFLEKESLLFHLLTHRFINDMTIVQEPDTIMTNSETNEDYNEIETVIIKANDYYKLERENEKQDRHIRIAKRYEETDSYYMTKHTRVMTRRMHLVAHKSINDTINIRKSRMTMNEKGPTQEHKQIEILEVHSAKHQPKNYCEDNRFQINIRTEKTCEARDSSDRNNAERTITVMVAKMNEQMKISNKKSTADDNTFIYSDSGRKSKNKLSVNTHVKCNNSSIKAKNKVTLFPHIKLGVKEHGKNYNTEAMEQITLKLPLIKLTKCDFLNNINEKLASDKMYKFCTLCKYATPYASRLTRHKLAHTKTFKCKHCNKGFRKSNDLKLHLRCHSGDRPFQCRCGAAFAKKNTLNRHLKTHMGEKSYNCTICSSKFKLLNGLKRHLKIHGEKTFKCTSCESSFSDGSSLKRHTRRHTGQKPYGCDSCKYCTVNSHDLKRHAKTCQGKCRRARQL